MQCGRRTGRKQKPEKEKEEAADAASTVRATRIWDFAFSLLGRLKTKMSLAFHSARNRPSEEKALKGVVWPCPLPFPTCTGGGATGSRRTRLGS